MSKKQGKKNKKKLNFSRDGKVFRAVLGKLRTCLAHPAVVACDYSKTLHGSAPNSAAPRPSDFVADCFAAIKSVLGSKGLAKFFVAYCTEDFDSDISQEFFAVHVGLGKSVECRCGAEFRRRGLYPLQGPGGYFNSVRGAISGEFIGRATKGEHWGVDARALAVVERQWQSHLLNTSDPRAFSEFIRARGAKAVGAVSTEASTPEPTRARPACHEHTLKSFQFSTGEVYFACSADGCPYITATGERYGKMQRNSTSAKLFGKKHSELEYEPADFIDQDEQEEDAPLSSEDRVEELSLGFEEPTREAGVDEPEEKPEDEEVLAVGDEEDQ